ncbi:MAG: hypothetical protein K2Y56_08980 [Methylobacterium sp.]|uniref:hypothetical protein n=1 Tax=Methylobacterium sp. TaxID=409 RepID=UPI0025F6666A|nr:hypothetical protein [Methylobacterium sp.]MBX9931655.1 hypothetical protein [Methylobacterium sp.]
MRREIVTASPASLGTGRRGDLGGALAAIGLAALALVFAFADPAGNVWSAAVLIGALGLDGLGRIASRLALRGPSGPGLAAMPSMVLASERGTMAVAFLFAAAAFTWPDRFPVLSSLVAGLLAMGGITRFVIAWTLFRAGRENEDE